MANLKHFLVTARNLCTHILQRSYRLVFQFYTRWFSKNIINASGDRNILCDFSSDEDNENTHCGFEAEQCGDSQVVVGGDKTFLGLEQSTDDEEVMCCICFAKIECQSPTLLLPCTHNNVVHISCVWDWVCCHSYGDPDTGLYYITCPICRGSKTTQLVSQCDSYQGPVRRRMSLRHETSV